MSKKLIIIFVAVIIVLIVAGAGYWLVTRENPHITRGKELLSIDDYEAAAKEFKICLKQEGTKKPFAQALLLYALANQANPSSFNVKDVLNIQVLLEAYDNPELMARLDEESREETRKSIIKIRKIFYEEGIDTKDSAELRFVLSQMADYVFQNEESGSKKDAAAYVLARKEKAAAKDYLLERTKSEKNEEVVDYLARLGSSVLPEIKRIMNDPQHLGRDKMWPIALAVLLNEAALDYFKKYPSARNVKNDALPRDLFTQQNAEYLNKSNSVMPLTRFLVEFGADLRDEKTRGDYSLNLFIANSPDEGEKAVVSLFGMDRRQKNISTRFYSIHGTELKPLKIKRKDVLEDSLQGEIPFLNVSHKAQNVIELAKPVVTELAEERIGGRPNMDVGTRVAVQGHKGKIVSIDEMELVHVQLDEPVDGLSEITVSREALRGIYMAKRRKPGYEVYTAKYIGDVLEIDESLTQKVESL